MLTLLSLATGLSFVYLLVSFIVSALNELVFSFFDQRAAFLKEGLRQLLGDHPETLRKFLGHGLIDAFSRRTGGAPAYIPADTFATALLDVITPADPAKRREAADIAHALALTGGSGLAQANPKLAQSLAALFDEAGGDLRQFRAGIERWFNQSVDRVSGWYKRRTQQWLFVFALLVAVAGNVDSLRIVQGLSADPHLRDSVVQAATDSIKQHASDAAGQPAPDEVGALAAQIKDSLTQLNALSLPVGWSAAQSHYLFGDPLHNWGHLFTAVAGWLMTALAASLGAPFWFDTLQRFVTIRGNGRTPAETEKAVVARVAAAAQAMAPAIAAATPEVSAPDATVVLSAPPE